MIILIGISTILGVLLIEDVTSKGLYLILYGFGIGIFSATGWPACLYVYLLISYFSYYLNILTKRAAHHFQSGMEHLNSVISLPFSSATS